MANVRLFTHEGMVSAPIASYSGKNSENAIWMLKQPYLANQTLAVNTGAAVSSDPSLAATNFATLLRVEVDEGIRIRYEISPPNLSTPRVATQDSPVLYGEDQLMFGKGYTISIIQSL